MPIPNERESLNYFDYLYPIGHAKINQAMIGALARRYNISVLAPPSLYSSRELPGGVKVFTSPRLGVRPGRFSNRWQTVTNMAESGRFAAGHPTPVTLLSSCDVLLLCLSPHSLLTRRSVLIHHMSIDEIVRSRVKRIAFAKCARALTHVVFEEYIVDALREYAGVPSSAIHVVPHPINWHAFGPPGLTHRAIGISGSNDEAFIDQIVELERELSLFAKAKCSVYLKSKRASFDNGFLVVSPRYVSNEDYMHLQESAQVMLFPFAPSFKFRTSATLIEALANGRQAITTDFVMARFYQQRFSSAVTVRSSPLDYCHAIIHSLRIPPVWGEWATQISAEHSFETFSQALLDSVDSVTAADS